MVGDYNMPAITWTIDDEGTGALIATNANTKYEQKFVELLNSNCLKQINSYPNANGIFLDLIMVTNNINCDVTLPNGPQLLDHTSAHHLAYITEFTYETLSQKPIIKFDRSI